MTPGSTDWYVNWSAVYGVLESGTYRYTATVLRDGVQASVEFTVPQDGEADLMDTLSGILNSDAYYIRYTLTREFGSLDALTEDQKDFISFDSANWVYEYWKSGEDLMQIMYRSGHPWVGMMYKDGVKYTLDHEGNERTNPVTGWNPWPDMDMNRLTDWISMITVDPAGFQAEYAADGTLTSLKRTVHLDEDPNYYNAEVTTTEVWEFVPMSDAEISMEFVRQDVDTALVFSWADDEKNMEPRDVTFVNTTAQPVSSASEAIARAMAECTVEHDKILVYRDAEAGMWKVEFQILYGYQGYQYVYLDDQGITRMVSGAGSKVEEWRDLYPGP